MIHLWVKCLCLLVSVISSTKHKYLLPCYAPKGCRSQKEAESSEKVSIIHSHLCIMYVWCAVVCPYCIHHLYPNCLPVMLFWDAVSLVCPCKPLVQTICSDQHAAILQYKSVTIGVCLCSSHDETDGCGSCSQGENMQVPNWLQMSFPSQIKSGHENEGWSFPSYHHHQTAQFRFFLGRNYLH